MKNIKHYALPVLTATLLSLSLSGCVGALIGGAAAWFLGTVTDRYVGGDHVILTVTVDDCGWEEETRPLIYQRGKLHHWPDELG